MSTAATWREVLAHIVSDPQEKQRLCSELNIVPTTLTNWVEGEKQPSIEQFQQLLEALPDHRQILLPSIALELEQTKSDNREGDGRENTDPNNSSDGIASGLPDVPAEFYAQILRGHASTPQTMHSWYLGSMILYQALLQLDPERKGLSLTLVRCMSPSTNGKVRSFIRTISLYSRRISEM